MVSSEWRIGQGHKPGLFATRRSLLTTSLLHRLRRQLRRRRGLFGPPETIGFGGGSDVVGELGDARGVKAEVALEIARGGADIAARVIPPGRDADPGVFAGSP